MKKIFLYVLFFLFCVIVNGQTPDWDWAKSARGEFQDYGISISSDAHGNCYATGYFQNPSVVFEDDTLTGSMDYHDSFYIVKYDSTGQKIWARSAGGENNAYGNCVSTDVNGNSYVTGYFRGSGTMDLGGITLVAGGSSEAFVAKYNPLGDVLWAKTAGGISDFGASSISVSNGIDSKGNVYVAINNPDFMTDTTFNFIQKYNSAGDLIWQKPAYGIYGSPNIATDPSGNSYVTGCFMGASMSFGSYVLTNPTSQKIMFVVKYNTNGDVIWAKTSGDNGAVASPVISADTSGNSYVTGTFYALEVTFGSSTFSNAASDNMFVVKFNSAGDLVWAKSPTTSSAAEGHSIKTDANGNSYVTGMFNGITTFGDVNLYSAGSGDIFIVKYDSTGTALWGQTVSSGTNLGNGISIGQNDNIFVTGYFNSAHTDFGSFRVTNIDTVTGSSEIFIAKLSTHVTTGVSEQINLSNSIRVFPNPFSTETTINIDTDFKNATVAVYNMVGQKLIETKNVNGRTISLNREGLSDGMYFFRIVQDNKIITSGKLIVD